MTDQSQQTKVIQAYSIFEYTQKIEEAISEGYSFKLLTNEGTPQQFGFHYEVTMYKKEPNKATTDADLMALDTSMKDAYTDVKPIVQPQKQRGRPSAK